jgi:hypothetical protein
LRNADVGSSEYLTKGGVEWEMTYTHLKSGKGENRSPMQILADYARWREPADAELFQTYANAFKGARQLTWSGSIRLRYAAAREEFISSVYWRGKREEATCLLTRDTWEAIERVGIRETVLDASDELGLQGILWVMRTHGLDISGVIPVQISGTGYSTT